MDDDIVVAFKNFGEITFHRVGKHNLFIFPDLPSWIVLDDNEAIIFRMLLDGMGLDFISLEAKKLDIDIPNIEEYIHIIVNKLKNRKTFPYPSIAYDAHDADIYPTHIHLCLTHFCNLRCKHCFLAAGEKLHDELTIDQWIDGLSNVLNYIKNPYITVSGGEPTTYPSLKKLLMFLKEKQSNITLYTNGHSDLSNILHYVDAVQISLEGLSANTHDFIRGSGSFKRILKNIERMPDKSKIEIAFLILPHNFEEITSNLETFLDKYGISVNNIRLNAEIEKDGRANELDNSYHDFFVENAEKIFGFISSMFHQEPRLLLRNMRNCGIGISIGIDSNGKIYPCDLFFEDFASIFDKDIDIKLKDIRNINKKTEISNFNSCIKCDLRYICLGGCKIKNKQRAGSYTNVICTDNYKLLKYYRMIYDVGV
jgi:radical SAM protein with 4Fe4S-binding SPASM domain